MMNRVFFKRYILCLVVFVVAGLSMASIQFQKVEFVGADAYHHVRLADIISNEGLPDEFVWTQASVFKDNYADKQLFFHLLLIPFVSLDQVLGPKLLTVILAALLFGLIAWIMVRNKISWPWLWPTLMLAGGVLFLYRINLTRPHLLAVFLSILGFYLINNRRILGLFLLSVLFPLCYTAIHLLLFMVLTYVLVAFLVEKKIYWQLVLIVVLGTFLGIILHPHRANLLSLWYLQNIEVILNTWVMPEQVVMGNEFLAPAWKFVVGDTLVSLLGSIMCIAAVIVWRRKISLRTLFLLVLSNGFCVLFLCMARFVEYWVPFSILFMASTFDDLKLQDQIRPWFMKYKRVGVILFGLAICLLLFQTTRSVVESQLEVDNQPRGLYKDEALWLAEHLPDNQVVFTANWDSFPMLFYHAPRQRYLVALDPTFMQAYDSDLFELWYKIATGTEPQAADKIIKYFHTNWVLAEKDSWIEPFIKQAQKDARFKSVYSGPNAEIFYVDMPHP
jgi:hypothetical protein